MSFLDAAILGGSHEVSDRGVRVFVDRHNRAGIGDLRTTAKRKKE